MRKLLLLAISSMVVFNFGISNSSKAENDFSAALRKCSNYSKDGIIPYEKQDFNVSISLGKNLKKQCIYKEKIYQDVGYQLLTCTLTKEQLNPIANSMEKFNQTFKKEIAKNNIFEAKMTTNAEVFNKFLANPKTCQITYKKY